MTTPADTPTPLPQEPIILQLEALLVRQIQLAVQQDYDGVLELSAQVDELLEQADAIDITADQNDRLLHIRQLRRQLELGLALRRKDVLEQLEHMRLGRKTIRAYRSE